ncbi:hypothetical protein P3W85_39685 [Cupriavidus basilensis]|uniref:Uncharacterized protein n=1 Tax=Cupriavidus basilensis TaxID=68895 RepID=A0ABT6B298_9BURK|nr:hypothetical protein [Cupriavidus basilensis]MDF3839017.1 hypothetical protein [Cupriavidus basilensis]
MQPYNRADVYRLIAEILKNIASNSSEKLTEFGITQPIHGEIIDELESSGESIENLCPPPYSIAFEADSTGRVPLDIYETEPFPQAWRVSCQLWSGDRKTDLTLIADLPEARDGPSIIFRLLETQ